MLILLNPDCDLMKSILHHICVLHSYYTRHSLFFNRFACTTEFFRFRLEKLLTMSMKNSVKADTLAHIVSWMRFARSEGWEGFSAKSFSLSFNWFFSRAVRFLKCFWKRGVKVNSYAIILSPIYQTRHLRYQRQAVPRMLFWTSHRQFLPGVHSGIFWINNHRHNTDCSVFFKDI